jgi:hypothetical protein
MANKTFTVQASLMIITYDHQNIFIVQPAGDSIGPRFALLFNFYLARNQKMSTTWKLKLIDVCLTTFKNNQT